MRTSSPLSTAGALVVCLKWSISFTIAASGEIPQALA